MLRFDQIIHNHIRLMKLFTNQLSLISVRRSPFTASSSPRQTFQPSRPGSKPGLLLLLAAVAFLFTGSQSAFGRGYYGGTTVAAAGPRGAAVAGPHGAVAVGRNGGVAVAGGYRPPVYNSGVKVAVGPGGVAVAGPNGAVAIRRSYAPCYPTGYISVMPVGYTTVYYGGYHCYFVGGVYYRPEFYCGSTVYVVVTP